MNETDTPKIEFPCVDYPIKIFLEGEGDGVLESIYAIVQRHAADFDPSVATQRPSRNGRFLSLSVAIVATGEAQLKALHEDLLAHERVRLVL